jgi:hypothetical protein
VPASLDMMALLLRVCNVDVLGQQCLQSHQDIRDRLLQTLMGEESTRHSVWVPVSISTAASLALHCSVEQLCTVCRAAVFGLPHALVLTGPAVCFSAAVQCSSP